MSLVSFDRQLSHHLARSGFLSRVNWRARMWSCLMFMEWTTQTRWTGIRKANLKQFRNKNGSSELRTITIMLVWRSLALCTRQAFEFTSYSVSPHKCSTEEEPFQKECLERREESAQQGMIQRGEKHWLFYSLLLVRNLKHSPICLLLFLTHTMTSAPIKVTVVSQFLASLRLSGV